MSESIPQCARKIKWAGGEHTFDLSCPNIIKILETREPVSLPGVFAQKHNYAFNQPLRGQFGDTASAALRRFEAGCYTINDVECIIELGLWGGGDVTAEEAVDLVDEHVRGRPVAPNAVTAYEVLAMLFIGAAAAKEG